MPVADYFMAFPWNVSAAATPVTGEVCEICFRYFAAGKTALWKHMRDEHGGLHGDRLSCPVPGCGRRFVALAMSVEHAKLHAAEPGAPSYTCELCGHHVQNRSAFERHIAKKHPESREAMCGICHTYAGDVPSLVRHVRDRHGADLESEAAGGHKNCIIRCVVCGKRYGNHNSLYEHSKVLGLAAIFPV